MKSKHIVKKKPSSSVIRVSKPTQKPTRNQLSEILHFKSKKSSSIPMDVSSDKEHSTPIPRKLTIREIKDPVDDLDKVPSKNTEKEEAASSDTAQTAATRKDL